VAEQEQATLAHVGEISEDEPRKLSVIFTAMRKLREGIVAAARADAFSLRAYLFIIRLTILVRHMESYHPALLHLLSKIHPKTPLTKSELHESVGYCILNLACRQNDLAGAFRLKHLYSYSDFNIEVILRALVHGNWFVFRKVQDRLDIYQRRLVESAGAEMGRHAIECLGRSYLTVDKAYVESTMGRSWEQLETENSVAWSLEGNLVNIKRLRVSKCEKGHGESKAAWFRAQDMESRNSRAGPSALIV